MLHMDYRIPLYLQLQDIIIKKIEEGEYLPGSAIPGERKLAELYGVNRMTVKHAITELVDKGYLYRIHGSGTYVSAGERAALNIGYASETENSGITAMLKTTGIQVKNHVLGLDTLKGSRYLTSKLALKEEEPIYGLHRVRFSGEHAIAVEYTYVPCKYFEDMTEIDFRDVSLYDYMEARDHMPQHFHQRLIVIPAADKEARHLGIRPESPVFFMQYIGADKDYNIVEYTESYMNPDTVEFQYNSAEF